MGQATQAGDIPWTRATNMCRYRSGAAQIAAAAAAIGPCRCVENQRPRRYRVRDERDGWNARGRK